MNGIEKTTKIKFCAVIHLSDEQETSTMANDARKEQLWRET